MQERYTIEKHKWDSPGGEFKSFYASINGPTTGHAETETEAVEDLAKNLESLAASIRTGEIAFLRVGYDKDEVVQ